MLRMAVIGASGMARRHMEGILVNENSELVAICEINLERAKEAAEKLEIADKVKIYEDYMEMVKAEKIDAAVVVTPDGTHREIVVNLLNAGVDVLCEKPMALNLADCKAMIEAEKASGRKLMIGQVCRYTPAFIKAKELIDAGEIGELFYVESEYGHDYMHMGDNHWRVDPERHPIVGGGCHAVDLLRWIAGDPEEVSAYSNHKLLPKWPIDDCTISIMKFPNDVIGKVMCSIACKRSSLAIRSQFYGTKGTILCDNGSPEMTLFKPVIDENGVDHGGGAPIKIEIDINNHNATAEIAEFIDILINDKPVKTTGIEGASTVAACLAAVESSKVGGPVKVKYDF